MYNCKNSKYPNCICVRHVLKSKGYRLRNSDAISIPNCAFDSPFFSLNIMLRVSFSPGHDRPCRHCWISSFWTPWENGNYFLKKTLQSIPEQIKRETWHPIS